MLSWGIVAARLLRSLPIRLSKTPGRCRRGRSPSDFHSYPPALPAGRVVDFACKINSLQLRTTSGCPKLLPRKSDGNHFFDTLLIAEHPKCGISRQVGRPDTFRHARRAHPASQSKRVRCHAYMKESRDTSTEFAALTKKGVRKL